MVMNPQDANHEFIRGNVELVRLSEAEGRVAAEGAAVSAGRAVRGARRGLGGAVLRYFLALEEGSICCLASRRSCRGLQRDGSGRH